jgi:hypothetical protein
VASVTSLAWIAVVVVAALHACRRVFYAARHLSNRACDDDGAANALDTRFAVAAVAVIATFRFAGDGLIGRRPAEAANLVLRTDPDAFVHSNVTELAGIVAEERFTSALDTPLTWTAVFAVAAFLADAGTAEQIGRAIGGAGSAIRRVVLQVFAHAFAAGQALWTIGETWAAK